MIRLIVAIVLFLLSLLVVFRAPTHFLWLVAVAVTNYPFYFILGAVLILVSCFGLGNYRTVSMIISSVTVLLFLLPVVSAYWRGFQLKKEIRTAFPFKENKTQLEQPFSFLEMFSGIDREMVKPVAMEYKKGLSLDLYPAHTKEPAPCLIVVHGGSWQTGDNKEVPELNSYLANRGIHVASINYRLAPEYKCPSQVEDVKDALQFLCSNAGDLNIDTNNFILLGRSAGGQIALLAAYSLKNKNIKGAISFYGPNDMVWGADKPGNPWVMNTDKVLCDYIGGNNKQVPEKYAASSPYEFVTKNTVPSLLIHGANDALVAFEHNVRLSKKMEQNKVPYYFLDLPFATHACDYNINGPSGQLCTYAVERFINSVTAWKN